MTRSTHEQISCHPTRYGHAESDGKLLQTKERANYARDDREEASVGGAIDDGEDDQRSQALRNGPDGQHRYTAERECQCERVQGSEAVAHLTEAETTYRGGEVVAGYQTRPCRRGEPDGTGVRWEEECRYEERERSNRAREE